VAKYLGHIDLVGLGFVGIEGSCNFVVIQLIVEAGLHMVQRQIDTWREVEQIAVWMVLRGRSGALHSRLAARLQGKIQRQIEKECIGQGNYTVGSV
jgi:hypothetical protein